MNFSPRGVLYTTSKAFLKYIFDSSKYHQILRWAMLSPQPRVRKCVFLIIYGVPKTYYLSTPINIPSNKGKKSMYSYVFCTIPVSTRMSSVCHSYVLICHPYFTCMYSYVIHMSLVCGFTMNQKKTLETNPLSFLLNMYRT